ncbi:unnamed protein product [Dracunculus medinensis]|uniref:Inositol-pentakisphosphate 2-kinase n=1 Tax=Dracunculus medinensis TaxID=318479 RepID=A0A0N4UNV7_DRAME|nr:unnamed protein product [Dracunculus medinensis]
MRSAMNSLIMVLYRNLRIFFNGILLVGTPSNAEFILQETSVITGCPVGIVKTYEISQSLSLENQVGIRITLPVAFVVKELLNKCLVLRNDLSFMHENSDQALLQRYFLAVTMKDCSVMISLRFIDETITSIPHSRCSPPPIVKIHLSTIQHPDACLV